MFLAVILVPELFRKLRETPGNNFHLVSSKSESGCPSYDQKNRAKNHVVFLNGFSVCEGSRGENYSTSKAQNRKNCIYSQLERSGGSNLGPDIKKSKDTFWEVFGGVWWGISRLSLCGGGTRSPDF